MDTSHPDVHLSEDPIQCFHGLTLEREYQKWEITFILKESLGTFFLICMQRSPETQLGLATLSVFQEEISLSMNSFFSSFTHSAHNC